MYSDFIIKRWTLKLNMKFWKIYRACSIIHVLYELKRSADWFRPEIQRKLIAKKIDVSEIIRLTDLKILYKVVYNFHLYPAFNFYSRLFSC